MASRPSKRPKTDHLVPIGPGVVKVLSKVSKGGLLDCALGWIINNINPPPHQDSDTDNSDEQGSDTRSLSEIYAELRDSKSTTKNQVITRIQRDWVSLATQPAGI